MKRIVSRALIASVAMLALVAAPHHSVAVGEKSKPSAKEEIILLGPFTLADLCTKSPGKFFEKRARDGGPTKEAILKALNACKLYVLDKKIHQEAGWRFATDRPGEEDF